MRYQDGNGTQKVYLRKSEWPECKIYEHKVICLLMYEKHQNWGLGRYLAKYLWEIKEVHKEGGSLMKYAPEWSAPVRVVKVKSQVVVAMFDDKLTLL